MDPALKVRLDERLVSGEITPDEYQAIVKVLATAAPEPNGFGPKLNAPAVVSRAMTKRPETTNESNPEISRSSSRCWKCNTPQKNGVTFCSKCKHKLQAAASLEINWRMVGLYFFFGFLVMHRNRVFDDGIITGIWRLLIWPLIMLKSCVSG
ncbi:MAG: hypothetical protein JWR15_3463 [Prosthecobacter sp.]|nr:hypothetical protein [Prosthecobacter sp.]